MLPRQVSVPGWTWQISLVFPIWIHVPWPGFIFIQIQIFRSYVTKDFIKSQKNDFKGGGLLLHYPFLNISELYFIIFNQNNFNLSINCYNLWINMFPICISLLSSLGLLNLFPLIQVPFREPRSLNIKIKLYKSNLIKLDWTSSNQSWFKKDNTIFQRVK